MAVYIENPSGCRFQFHYKVVIQKAVNAVLEDRDIPKELDVNVLIVSPEEIRRINRETRNIDKVTDVLSFPYFEYPEAGVFDRDLYDPAEEEILGDIVVCGEKIISQAEEYGHSQKRELAFLIVHSMLHLTGYDHMEKKDAEIMEEQQRKIMDMIGISR
ncbi:MAG: rRNA maturation RNase YbeY [Parasporobacterium sp.]|nr:rRNA maturation RNase YbeY [Parasporobacterium sp.]